MGFGDFQLLCSNTPSYPWCNLFYSQLLRSSNATLIGLSNSTSSAPVGINPSCGIHRVGHDGSLSNIANIAVCGVSIFFVCYLVFHCHRRKAAVGRIELLTFLILYFLILVFQLITTGSFLEQGSKPLVILTAIHAALVITLFWSLLANALVATQVVEDGSMSSLIPFSLVAAIAFGVTLYISLDIGLGITTLIGGVSKPPQALKSIPLFILTSIWPAATAVLYFGIMLFIVVKVLKETRPVWFYILAAALFVLSQLAWFLLSRVICEGSNSRVDGSFVATILETATVGVLYLAWKAITEDDWDGHD